jgi:hypothetical protein
MKLRSFPWLALVLLLNLPAPARATVMVRLELKQLVGMADAIFVGRALHSRSFWTRDNRIVTETTFRVEQGVHGVASGQTLTVRSLGGTVDGIGMYVPGAPRFSPGVQVVLFVGKPEAGKAHFVVGMRQGVFPVRAGRDGQAQVHVELGGLELVRPTPSGLRPLEPLSRQPRPLAEFVTRLGQLVKLCGQQRELCRRPF